MFIKKILILIVICIPLFFMPSVSAEYHTGDHVADFTLQDSDGHNVSLSDFSGMGVVLAFWSPT